MEIIKGIGVSPGVVICTAVVLDAEDYRVPRRLVSPDQRRSEIHRLRQAFLDATEEVSSLQVARAGCVCEGVGDYPGQRVVESFLINRRLTDDQARQLAAKLGRLPVLREWDSRTTEDAVLVLGLDHAESRRSLDELPAP